MRMNLTKFLPPKPAHVLQRERLTNRLLEWEDKKLVIIHAQAGQGKSTLAAGYVQSLCSPSVWYTMDREDENPAVFLSMLGAAIQRAWPKHVPEVPSIPLNRYSTNGIRQDIGKWIEQVFGNIPKPGLLVFDDYTPPSSSPVLLHLMKQLIDCSPPHIRFMIISRVRPELDIAKLRAAQSVGELAGDDLKFTDSEVQDLFGIVFSMHISPNEAALINSTAEGWPAGLVLMHEYLSTLAPGARALAIVDRRAAGFRTHVFDYLAQEVFAHLPQPMQRFLLQTSVVDVIPAPLIELLTGLPRTALSGTMSIAAMVKDLRDRNLFLTALDNDTLVIRYHALFREFLRKKLIAQTRPAEVKKLYTRAAAYFGKNGDRVRSIDLFLASGQFDHAVKRIEACGEEMIACGQTGTLIRWIETLPLKDGNRPWFLFYRAVAGRFTDSRTALTFFDLAFKGFRSGKTSFNRTSGLMYSLCGIIEACFHTGGDFTRMGRDAALAQTLLKQNRRASPGARARLLLAMGMAWFFIGRLQQASDALRQALDLFRKLGDHFYHVTTAIYLTPCALYQGDFPLARETVSKGLEANASIPDEAGGHAALLLVAAMTSLFAGDFAEAQKRLDQCRDLADSHALESMVFLSLDIGGWLKIAQGDYPGAVLLLTECKRKGEESRNAFFSASAAHLLAIAFLFQGKLEEAKKESDYALAIRTQSGSTLFHAIYLIASGAIHVKIKKYRQAEKELLIAVKMLQQIKATQQEANAHLVLARLYGITKRTDSARKHLREGFCIGQKRGFTYYALFDAVELAELANAALGHGICVDYCSQLINNQTGPGTTPLLEINCLGGFRAKRGKVLIRDSEWKSKQAKTFVKLLVAQDGYAVSRDIAMETLWPDMDPDTLGPTYNSMLHRVRKVLEPKNAGDKSSSCILQADGVIMLNKDLVRTDVGQLLHHLDTTDRMRSGQKPESITGEYEKAFDLYEGDFLPEDLYSDWAAPMRDRLRIRYLRALEDAAMLAESSGDRDRTLRFYERMFSEDPCNEKACCWLMTRYHSDTRRGEAVRTYERCERAMNLDLDLEPDENTKKLYRRIIGG
jgi:ATP/maltotriose-dependent transcriptional regulator MalT/DNA-binding SARP family transcriptional activator